MSLCPFGHHKLIIYLFSIQLSDVVLVLLSKIRSTSDLRLRSKTTGSILGIIFKIFVIVKGLAIHQILINYYYVHTYS